MGRLYIAPLTERAGNESACHGLVRRLLFPVCAEMVLQQGRRAERAACRGLEASVCLPFFDNCIVDGRDTLAAPLCFLRVSVGNSLGIWFDHVMNGALAYELC